ncbi:unnamed protein product [Rhizoctonia solani]|uniref:Endonuclease/exonuclease/phosphatase domain-containing protein n=1 Tax=Rhizoctonia solani TaxID=456999 RepID=A0A8H3C6M3_9AGAM|nr:unnamed protein product [Rhizoctonia solani]
MKNSVSTIINAYAHSKNKNQTIEFITNINIPKDCTTILCRDFNPHHLEWAIPGSKWEKACPNAMERLFNNFSEYNDLHLFNDPSLPTHFILNHPESNTIIDLTFLNSQAIDAWEDFNWEVEPQESSKSLGSNHAAITWTIRPHNPAKSDGVMEPSPRYTINASCQDKWTSRYMQSSKMKIYLKPLPWLKMQTESRGNPICYVKCHQAHNEEA